ncbi:MAG: hypothetical protein LBR10_08160 [Prevotellaceae bacterium]|jgi:ribosomal protein L37E|nr:hypothetical protein [Prevotellaceae bacterium]
MDKVKITCNQCGTPNFSSSKYCCGYGYELPKEKLNGVNRETIVNNKPEKRR